MTEPAFSTVIRDPAPPPRILVMANQKGGVGKTTTAINLGTALAAIGESVLIVDLDPQGNASTGLGVELEISGDADRSYKLRNALRTDAASPAGDGDRTTYVLVDCPPSLNLLTVNALAAANSVIVPLQCEFFALEGLSQLLSTVEQVRRTVNPELTIHGVVLTMFDPRNSLAGQVVADVRAHMGDKVYDTVIPRNVRLSEAPSHGKPALLYDLRCAGSQAYLRLASEVIQRERRWSAA